MGSVRTVTVLITDLVGSTALESRIGAVAAHEIRVEHFALIQGAVQEAGGRDVKNTGDGLMAVFDSATAGLSCAASVQQRLDWRNRSAREELLVKVGISAGDATVAADGDCFGMPVIEAARLCDHCAGGQILARSLVADLADGRGHAFGPERVMDLKGLPAPLPAVEVIWERQPETAGFPLPGQMPPRPLSGLLGREPEVQRLAELFAAARGGGLRLALVSADAGLGKTSLAGDAALEAHTRGAVVLLGRCASHRAVPYGPWAEALAHLVEHAPADLLGEHAERHGGELARLVPGLSARVPGLPPPRETDPETARYLLWEAVTGLLRAMAQRDPVVLWLDDLDAADASSLRLLCHILPRAREDRVLVLGTCRGCEPPGPLASLLTQAAGEDGVTSLTLEGLGQSAVARLIEHAMSQELHSGGVELSQRLWRETGGNPFYLREVLRYLVETRALWRDDAGQFVLSDQPALLQLPDPVTAVTGARIGRLPPAARQALTAAAVIGDQFDLGLLARVTGEPSGGDAGEPGHGGVRDLLAPAVSAALTSESGEMAGRFSFAHDLVAEALLRDLDDQERARLHRRVALALEQQPGAQAGELAWHWSGAVAAGEVTAGDTVRAAGRARLAGEQALALLAPNEALHWFGRALELLEDADDPAQRCDALTGLGEAQCQAGDPDYRRTLLAATGLATRLHDADRAARAALAAGHGSVSVFGTVDAVRLNALRQAAGLSQQAEPARRALLAALESLELRHDADHARRRAVADEALSLAREAADPRTLAEVLRSYIDAVSAPDTVAAVKPLTDELADAARQARDPALAFWASCLAANARAQSGDVAGVRAELDKMSALASSLGQPSLDWLATYPAAGWEIVRGDLDSGERLAERALSLGTAAGQPDAPLIYHAQLGHIRVYQGRGEEIIGTLERLAAARPGNPAWRAALAAASRWTGRAEQAARMIREAAADGFGHVPWDQHRLVTLALYAEAATPRPPEPGDADIAGRLEELLEPWADQLIWNGVVGYGLCRIYLGMLATTLGRGDRADEHLAIAVEFHETADLPMCAARSHLAWAESLSARGEDRRAAGEARRTAELARRLDCGSLERRAALLAAAC